MKVNVGNTDKTLRTIIGIGLLSLSFYTRRLKVDRTAWLNTPAHWSGALVPPLQIVWIQQLPNFFEIIRLLSRDS